MLIDTGFRPSVHGFAFRNAWHDTLLGVFASRGRCGGMVFLALDRFAAGSDPETPSATTEAPSEAHRGVEEMPPYDSPLARLIWRRQVDSVVGGLGVNLWRFARLTYLPTQAALGAARTARSELDGILRSLAEGRPVPLGLVSALGFPHLARNHQVLAYAAETRDDRVLLRVYDPNHPLRDDVAIVVPLDAREPIVERIGARVMKWRGLFAERYVPVPGVGRRAGAASPSTGPDALRRVWGMAAIGAVVGLLLAAFVRRRR